MSRELVAAHEAGHVVCAHLHGRVVARVTIEAGDGTRGETELSVDVHALLEAAEADADCRELAAEVVATALAGPYAHLARFPDAEDDGGADGDHARARWAMELAPDEAENGAGVEGESRARAVRDRYAAEIDAIAAALLERGTLDAGDLDALLGPPPARWSRPWIAL